MVHKNINLANIMLTGPQRRLMLINFDIPTTLAKERSDHYGQIADILAWLALVQTGHISRAMDHRATCTRLARHSMN